MAKQNNSIIFVKDTVSWFTEKNKNTTFFLIPANRENNDLLLFFEPQQIINFLGLKL